MAAGSLLRLAGTNLRTSWQAVTEFRGAFLLQMSFMVLNDFVWVLFWLLLFRHTDTIRGWQLEDIMVLFGIFATAIGIACGLFNTRDIARMAVRGDLDPLLTQPRPVLLRAMLSRVEPAICGDLVFGPVIFALSGQANLQTIPLFVVAVLCSAAVIIAFLVLLHSSVFWLRGRMEASDFAWLSLTVFGMYPASIFGGVAKVIVFTVLPTAFVSTMPATLVTEPQWSTAGTLLLAVAVFATLATLAWHVSLRRYLHEPFS